MTLENKIKQLREEYLKALENKDELRMREIKKYAFFVQDLIKKRDSWSK